MGHRDEARARPEEALVRVQQDLPRVVDGGDAQARALLGAEELPGHDVGVVLQQRQDDLVALAHVAPPPALGDQVDPLGRPAHEDDLARGAGPEETPRGLARAFVGVGRSRRQGVRRAVDVGVLALVEAGDALDDRARLLRGGGVVEPDERTPVHLLGEDGKVAPHGGGVEGCRAGARSRGRPRLRDRISSRSGVGGARAPRGSRAGAAGAGPRSLGGSRTRAGQAPAGQMWRQPGVVRACRRERGAPALGASRSGDAGHVAPAGRRRGARRRSSAASRAQVGLGREARASRGDPAAPAARLRGRGTPPAVVAAKNALADLRPCTRRDAGEHLARHRAPAPDVRSGGSAGSMGRPRGVWGSRPSSRGYGRLGPSADQRYSW